FEQQQDGIVIESAEADGIELTKEAGDLVVPGPAEIGGEGPEPFLRGADEAAKRTGFADDGRNLGRDFRKKTDFVGVENAHLGGLNHEHALQDTAIENRHTEE